MFQVQQQFDSIKNQGSLKGSSIHNEKYIKIKNRGVSSREA